MRDLALLALVVLAVGATFEFTFGSGQLSLASLRGGRGRPAAAGGWLGVVRAAAAADRKAEQGRPGPEPGSRPVEQDPPTTEDRVTERPGVPMAVPMPLGQEFVVDGWDRRAAVIDLTRRARASAEDCLRLTADAAGGAEAFTAERVAARTHRSFDAIVLLTGEDPYEPAPEPLRLSDVARLGALSVTGYDRVSPRFTDDPPIDASLVAPLAHLIGELLEPLLTRPGARATIGGEASRDGFELTLLDDSRDGDAAFGLTDQQITVAQRCLLSPTGALGSEQELAFAVAGEIARYLQLSVRIARGRHEGVAVTIPLPLAVTTGSDASRVGRASAAPQPVQTAAERVPEMPAAPPAPEPVAARAPAYEQSPFAPEPEPYPAQPPAPHPESAGSPFADVAAAGEDREDLDVSVPLTAAESEDDKPGRKRRRGPRRRGGKQDVAQDEGTENAEEWSEPDDQPGSVRPRVDVLPGRPFPQPRKGVKPADPELVAAASVPPPPATVAPSYAAAARDDGRPSSNAAPAAAPPVGAPPIGVSRDEGRATPPAAPPSSPWRQSQRQDSGPAANFASGGGGSSFASAAPSAPPVTPTAIPESPTRQFPGAGGPAAGRSFPAAGGPATGPHQGRRESGPSSSAPAPAEPAPPVNFSPPPTAPPAVAGYGPASGEHPGFDSPSQALPFGRPGGAAAFPTSAEPAYGREPEVQRPDTPFATRPDSRGSEPTADAASEAAAQALSELSRMSFHQEAPGQEPAAIWESTDDAADRRDPNIPPGQGRRWRDD